MLSGDFGYSISILVLNLGLFEASLRKASRTKKEKKATIFQ